VSYEVFKGATEADLKPMRIHEGTIGASRIKDYFFRQGPDAP